MLTVLFLKVITLHSFKYSLLFSFLLFHCLFSNSSLAETVLNYNVNGSNSWYPYSIAHNPQEPGILGESIPKILAMAKIKSQVNNFPPKRTNQALLNGDLDFDVVSPSWFSGQEINRQQFVQSIPIMPIVENIIVLPENAAKWQSLSAIKGQPIGTVFGYLYKDDADFIRVDFKSERELILALQKGRIEAAISGDYPARYWAKKFNFPISLAAIHSSGDLVIRLRKEHSHLLPAINSAIETLKHSGELQTIIDKYISVK
jgi:polar amino acid transport system substrate-binding protein